MEYIEANRKDITIEGNKLNIHAGRSYIGNIYIEVSIDLLKDILSEYKEPVKKVVEHRRK